PQGIRIRSQGLGGDCRTVTTWVTHRVRCWTQCQYSVPPSHLRAAKFLHRGDLGQRNTSGKLLKTATLRRCRGKSKAQWSNEKHLLCLTSPRTRLSRSCAVASAYLARLAISGSSDSWTAEY